MSLYPQKSVPINPHQRNFCLQHIDTITENHNQLNCKIVKPNSSGYINKTTPASKAEGTLCEMRLGDCESQRLTEFAMRLCLSPSNVRRSTTHKFSRTWLNKYELSKDNNRHVRVDGTSCSYLPKLSKSTTGKKRMQKLGEKVFFLKENNNSLFIIKYPALKTYIKLS